MAPTLLARMLNEIAGVEYLKEETALAPQVMTRVRELAGASLKGTMGGMAGRYLLEEYRRGAVGTLEDPSIEQVTGDTYGPLKALCEQAVELIMPDRATIIFPKTGSRRSIG